MLWTPNKIFSVEPFEAEKDLEAAILEVKDTLFGKSRIYLYLKNYKEVRLKKHRKHHS